MTGIYRRFFVSKYTLHVVFWTLQILSNALSEITIYEHDKLIYFLNLSILHALQIFFCCLNVFVLIPRIYKAGNKLVYWLLLLLFIFIYSYSIYRMQNYFFRNYFSQYETLSKTIYHLSLNAFSIIRNLVITVMIAFAREWLLRMFLEKEQKVERAESEVRFLRSQLNPHFLFNTLNNIYGLVLTRSSQAQEIVLKLSDIMKYILYEANEEKVSLEKDVDTILNYIDLERLRQGNNAYIETNIAGNLKDQFVTPLLILPLVENAFKHGVNGRIKNGFLKFSLNVQGTVITTEIINTKSVNRPEEDKNRMGIGLKNLRRRLMLFYPDKHKLDIIDTDETFTVNLVIDTK